MEHETRIKALPIESMYGIYTYIRLSFMVNVGRYTIHGSYGLCKKEQTSSSTSTSSLAIGGTYSAFHGILAFENCNKNRKRPLKGPCFFIWRHPSILNLQQTNMAM